MIIVEAHGPAAAGRVIATWTTLAPRHAGRTDDFSPPVIRRELKISSGSRAGAHGRRVASRVACRQCLRGAVRIICEDPPDDGRSARRGERHAQERDRRCRRVDDTGVTGQDEARRHAAVEPQRRRSLPLCLWGRAGDVIFTYDGARPIPKGARARKRRLDQACGVTGRRLHDLRRTARTLLSRAGVMRMWPSGALVTASAASGPLTTASDSRRNDMRFSGLRRRSRRSSAKPLYCIGYFSIHCVFTSNHGSQYCVK